MTATNLVPTTVSPVDDFQKTTTCFYVVEVMERRDYFWCVLVPWLLILVLSSFALSMASEQQFDCFPFCATYSAEASCAALHAQNNDYTSWDEQNSSCFDPLSSVWVSSQSAAGLLASPHHSVIPSATARGRRFLRFVLRFSQSDYAVDVARAAAAEFRCLQLTNQSDGQLLPAPVAVGVLPAPSSVRLASTGSDENSALVWEFPIGTNWPAETQQFVLDFSARGCPLTRNTSGENASFAGGAVQFTVATTNPTYVYADAIARYVLMGVGVAGAFAVNAFHATRNAAAAAPIESVGVVSWLRVWLLWREIRAASTAVQGVAVPPSNARGLPNATPPPLVRVLVALALSSALFCDPLAGVFAAAPQVVFLQEWSLRWMPFLRMSTMFLGTAWTAALVQRGAAGALMYSSSSPSAAWRGAPFGLALFLAAGPLCSYAASVVTGLVNAEPSLPTALGAGYGLAMLPAVAAVYCPTILVLCVLVFRSHRVLYERMNGIEDTASPRFGLPSADAFGVRAAVIWSRLVLPIWLCAWVVVGGPYIGLLSFVPLLPVYQSGGLVECVLGVSTSLTVSLLTVPLRYSCALRPPRPSDGNPRVAAATVTKTTLSRDEPAQLYQRMPAAAESAASSEASAPLLELHGPPPPTAAAAQGVAASPAPGGYGLCASISESTEQGAGAMWMRVLWTPQHFAFVHRRRGFVGYAFDSESQRESFEARHAHLARGSCQHFRSFLCWETVVCALNMSNEAYNDVKGADDIDHLVQVAEYQETCCESAITKCCCCLSGGSGGNDDDDVIVPVQQEEASGRLQPSARRFTDVGRTPGGGGEGGASREGNGSASEAALEDADFDVVEVGPEDSPLGSPTSNSGGKQSSASKPKLTAQINVRRFGFQLIKVMDVFGVRVVVAVSRKRRPEIRQQPQPHEASHTSTSAADGDIEPSVLCIAFRGTVNLRNALTDVNAQMMQHPEMLPRCKVHRGFWVAFEHILPHLKTSLETFASREPARWKSLTSVLCTGHSLGGALATLCANSLSTGSLSYLRCHMPPQSGQEQQPPLGGHPVTRLLAIRCYTFGAPSVGNDNFVRCLDAACPELYRVVNENDLVARVGPCWQSHGGRQILINRDGDAIIEGTWLENLYVPTVGAGSSIKNHFLVRYGNSVDNVLTARNLGLLSPTCCSFLLMPL